MGRGAVGGRHMAAHAHLSVAPRSQAGSRLGAQMFWFISRAFFAIARLLIRLSCAPPLLLPVCANSWTTKGVASAVVIELREEKILGTTLALTLATSQPNDDGGSATFTIPHELSIAEDYFVRVIDAADEDVVGESGLFQISGFMYGRDAAARRAVRFVWV